MRSALLRACATPPRTALRSRAPSDMLASVASAASPGQAEALHAPINSPDRRRFHERDAKQPAHRDPGAMALPSVARDGLLPSEMEYLASTETMVRILPLASIDRVRLLSGTYGPFRPPAHAEVPLWLAIHLRKKLKCVVVPPDWLSVDVLSSYVRQETTAAAFAPVPLHYLAIAKLLLEQCVALLRAATTDPSAAPLRISRPFRGCARC